CGALVVSTAVEETVPDVAAARARSVPIVHRSGMLAYWVSEFRSVAVSGTSGKSTTTAMVFEILRGAGRDPSVITGGDLVALQQSGYWGRSEEHTSELQSLRQLVCRPLLDKTTTREHTSQPSHRGSTGRS